MGQNANKHLLNLTILLSFALLIFSGCEKRDSGNDGEDDFFERQNAAHNGDYLATYPLSNADSCIIRLKAEVPEKLQSWACLSIWYHMPRTHPEVNFRLLELYEENYPHDTVSAFAQMVRGEFYVDLAKFDSARICLEDAYRRYIALDRPLDASDATYLMARSYVYQNNFAKALESYFTVLDLLDAHDTTFAHRRASLYHDISVAYERSNNRPQQLKWLKKAWNADPSKLDKAWVYRMRMASNFSTYYLIENPDSSLFWAKLAIEIHQENDKTSLPPPRLVYWLGRAYFKKKECATALPYFLDAYRRNPDKNVLFGYYQFGLVLGECYLCIGKLDSAEYYLKESLASPDTGNLSVSHGFLSEVAARRGDFSKALAAAKESRRLFEKKFTADKAKAVAELEARYETAQKERRIATLEQEQKNARLQGLAGVLILLMALGLTVALFMRQRGRRLILEQQNRILEQDKELALARELLKAKELEQSQTLLKNTQKELDNTARLLALKNQLIQELEMKLTNRRLAPPDSEGSRPAEDHSMRSMKILTDEDWLLFRERFEQNFPGYLGNLKIRFSGLTAAEIRLFLLVKLNFDKKEIAETLGISQESVWRSRHRLSKKLGLTVTGGLDEFIREF